MKRNAASHHGHTSESHFAMLAAAALLLAFCVYVGGSFAALRVSVRVRVRPG